jgi:CubicO group peptidase (beta-lactamase class C family)
VAQDGRVVSQVAKGYANFQFAVPVASDTRFPIASLTKLFTAVLTLQLVEQGRLRLDTPAAAFLPDLPVACRAVTMGELLTHHAGLQNEPLRAYQTQYAPAAFVQQFVARDERVPKPAFRYNNVDYVLLTRLLEVATQQPYAQLVQANILAPLGMHDSGALNEARVIPRLAYGYHNYTFGGGTGRDTFRSDGPKYLSNYAGAGALYFTVAYLLTPQRPGFVDEARGYPTAGLYYNDRTFPTPVLERRGSIEGFNALLLISKDFRKIVIILNNTDTGDLEQLGDKVYAALK